MDDGEGSAEVASGGAPVREGCDTPEVSVDSAKSEAESKEADGGLRMPAEPPELVQVPVATVAAQDTAAPVKEKHAIEIPSSRTIAHAEESREGSGFNEIDNQAGCLHQLIERRYYGFAEAHVEAMRQMLEGSDISNHYIVLRALVGSLYSMDCQFEFDGRVDDDLKGSAENSQVTACTLCDAPIMALGVLGWELPACYSKAPRFDGASVMRLNKGSRVTNHLPG